MVVVGREKRLTKECAAFGVKIRYLVSRESRAWFRSFRECTSRKLQDCCLERFPGRFVADIVPYRVCDSEVAVCLISQFIASIITPWIIIDLTASRSSKNEIRFSASERSL